MPALWKYKVILWDFDGTLVSSQGDVWASLAYAAAQLGGSLPEGYASDPRNLADSIGSIFRRVTPFPGEQHEQEFEDVVAVHYRHLNDHAHTKLHPGMYQLLEDLRGDGIISHIVTMKPKEALVRILHTKGWRELFTGWDTPDHDAGAERSKTRMVADAVARYRVSREDCVLVGDSASDAVAAHANGIDFIAVTYGDGDTAQLLRQRATGCARQTADLRAILLERN